MAVCLSSACFDDCGRGKSHISKKRQHEEHFASWNAPRRTFHSLFSLEVTPVRVQREWPSVLFGKPALTSSTVVTNRVVVSKSRTPCSLPRLLFLILCFRFRKLLTLSRAPKSAFRSYTRIPSAVGTLLCSFSPLFTVLKKKPKNLDRVP